MFCTFSTWEGAKHSQPGHTCRLICAVEQFQITVVTCVQSRRVFVYSYMRDINGFCTFVYTTRCHCIYCTSKGQKTRSDLSSWVFCESVYSADTVLYEHDEGYELMTSCPSRDRQLTRCLDDGERPCKSRIPDQNGIC